MTALPGGDGAGAGELAAVRTESEQPAAPYLEALVAYAFRGPGRFHVPGHKGGPGADPGLRKAIGSDALAADVPQGNHALCLALAPLGARVVAQRNSHASIVDGLVLSGGVPTFVAPEYDEELGMAHGVRPEALEEALTQAAAA